MSIFAEEKGLKELLGLVRKASNGAGCWFTRWITWYLFYPFAHTFTAGCSLCLTIQGMSWCWGTQHPDASPLHPDLSYIGNFKTLPVPFCSSRTCCFPLDPQILRVYFHMTVRDQKVLGAFLAEKEKNAVPYLQQILLLELSGFTSNKVLLHTW